MSLDSPCPSLEAKMGLGGSSLQIKCECGFILDPLICSLTVSPNTFMHPALYALAPGSNFCDTCLKVSPTDLCPFICLQLPLEINNGFFFLSTFQILHSKLTG